MAGRNAVDRFGLWADIDDPGRAGLGVEEANWLSGCRKTPFRRVRCVLRCGRTRGRECGVHRPARVRQGKVVRIDRIFI